MPYQRIKPTPPLDRHVENFWVQEDLTPPGPSGWPPTRILPTGKLDLVYFYGDPFVQITPAGEVRLPRLLQTGQWTRPVLVRATGPSGVLILSFHPWGAHPFLGVPMVEALDQHVGLDQLLPPARAAEILERLDAAASARQRVRTLETFLLGIFEESRHDALVELAVRRVNADGGSIPIQRLADDLRLSRRHLARRFQKTVGVSPKSYARINRFQKALGMKRMGLDWNRIVELCGHSDQAHFIHEIKTFTGFSPDQLRLGPDHGGPLAQHFNFSDLSHFYNTVYL